MITTKGYNYMSKRSMFWNDASGKLGNTVLYRAGGEQRARQYVQKIKNPKTLAQMTQRLSMGNMNAIFRQLKDVILQSFPQKATNQSAWNAFVQANANTPKVAINKYMLEQGVCVPFGYTVSKGNIPINTDLKPEDLESIHDPDAPVKTIFLLDGFIPATRSVVVPYDPYLDAQDYGSTSEEVYTLFHGEANPYNLPEEFKVTVIASKYGNVVADFEAFDLTVAQIVAKKGSTEKFKTLKNAANVNVVGLAVYGSLAEKGGSADIDIDKVGIIIRDAEPTNAKDYVVGIIISYTQNGKIHCTTSTLCAGDPNNANFKQFKEGGDIWNQILEEYGYNAAGVLATK